MKRSVVYLLWAFLLGVSYEALATPIPVKPCKGQERFYCIDVGGAALKKPVIAIFDSASSALHVPAACLNPANIKTIKKNVLDEWGRPADIVEGSIQLTDSQGNLLKVNQLQFFSLHNIACDAAASNFGSFMAFVLPDPNNSSLCVTSFFNNYIYHSVPPNKEYGYVMANFKNGSTAVELGGLAAELPYYQLQKRVINCGGMKNLTTFNGRKLTHREFAGVPGFVITVNSVPIPNTQRPNPGTDDVIGIIDTGGGGMNIYDDENHTVLNTIDPKGVLFSQKNCQNVSWLKACRCLKSGVKITVDNYDMNIHYQYASTPVTGSYDAGVFICSRADHPVRLPPAGSVNLGKQLFKHNNVTFDFGKGRIGFHD